jgi:GxxExxY protein
MAQSLQYTRIVTEWTFQESPLVRKVIGCAMAAHDELGSGLFESAYKECCSYEFTLAGIPFRREVPIPLIYKGNRLPCVYRADFVVDDVLLLEVKSVERLVPIHDAQVLTYLKLLNVTQGLLLNFNVKHLKNGIKSLLLDADRRASGSEAGV